MTDEPSEALRRIEQRLAAASDAAARLIAEAARGNEAPGGNQTSRATQREKPPPAGWQVPEPDRPTRRSADELELMLAGLRLMGELVPAEVLERLTAALRELLLAARALIDFYLERLEPPSREPSADVRDIPIE